MDGVRDGTNRLENAGLVVGQHQRNEGPHGPATRGQRFDPGSCIGGAICADGQALDQTSARSRKRKGGGPEGPPPNL
jgi:hypothetical protein